MLLEEPFTVHHLYALCYVQVVAIDGVIAAVAQDMVEDIRARDAAEASAAVDLAASLHISVQVLASLCTPCAAPDHSHRPRQCRKRLLAGATGNTSVASGADPCTDCVADRP